MENTLENNLENKAKFFAQHWENQYLIQKAGIVFYVNEKTFPVKEDYFLLRKPLSSITDEELVIIAKFYEPTAHNVKLGDGQILFDFIYGDQGASGAIEISDGYCLDWLRSNGFATEWMDLSIEGLINFGWIKLKNTES